MLLLAFMLAAVVWAYAAGRQAVVTESIASGHEGAQAAAAQPEQVQELLRLRGMSAAGESRVQMEQAAQQQLVRQIRLLEDENARLKEDLALVESLGQVDQPAERLGIHRLRIDPSEVNPHRYRYQMWLVMSGDAREREFHGILQLEVKLVQDGRDVVMLLPAAGEPVPVKYRVGFRGVRRIEGDFVVPEQARVKQVEARLLQNGQVKASSSMTM
jgi:hypothetical protein